MRKVYPVQIDIPQRIRSDKNTYKNCRKAFRRHGLFQDDNTFTGVVNKRQYTFLNKYCQYYNIKLRVNNQFSNRSPDYRKSFFSKHYSLSHYYFCAYCGKLMNRRDLTVDHLYPVDAAKTDLKLQKKLKRKGFKTINDPKNLVPACYNCNKKKSANMGLWIIRGKLGRHPTVWILWRIIKLILYIFIIYLVYIYFTQIAS